MKLEVVSHQISLVGKVKELAKIESTLAAFAQYVTGEQLSSGDVFDSSDEECDFIDIGFAYSQDEYKIADIKKMWKEFKKSL